MKYRICQTLKCFFFVFRLVNLRTRLATWRNSTCGYLRLLTSPFGQGLRLIVEKNIVLFKHYFMGGEVASWFVRSTPVRALLVRDLAGDIVLCSRARHFALTAPTSTLVYKWVNTNLLLLDNPAMDKHPIQGKVEILLVDLCYGHRDKLDLA